MLRDIQNGLVIGVPEHWETDLMEPVPVWGLKERYQTEFRVLHNGDIIWIYATAPVRGVVGVGMVKDKYIDYNEIVW
jgi:hypothetical protein